MTAHNGGVEISLIGWDKIEAKLGNIAELVPGAADDAMYIEAEKIMADSKEHYVPVKTGALRASGTVERGDDHSVEMTYGNEKVDYAIYVHENPFAHHPIGEWKYLETPWLNAQPGLITRIAEYIFKKAFLNG